MIKTILSLILIPLFGVTLVSCTSNEMYDLPSVDSSGRWSSSDSLTHQSQLDLPMFAWWQNLHDAQLSRFIQRALKNNNDIHSAAGNVIAAQGQLEQVEFSWLPSIGLFFGRANDNSAMLNTGYNLGVLPSYNFNFLQFVQSKEWAQANVAMAQASENAITLSVISQTAGAYFTYLAQNELLKQQQLLVQDYQQLLFLTKKQYKKGYISFIALQQYEQQYYQVKSDLALFTHNKAASANALKVLLNENPGAIKIKTDFMKIKSDDIIPVNLPSQVLLNRPDVQQAEQQLRAAHANVDVATATFFPSITLTSAAATASDQLTDLFSNGTDFWHYQWGLNFPLLDPTLPGKIKQAKGQYQAAYYHYVQTARIAFQSVDDDLSAHAQYYASFQDQQKIVASAKKSYELANINQQKGLFSGMRAIENKIAFDQASINFSKAKLAQLMTIVKLYQDLGGGYNVNHEEAT